MTTRALPSESAIAQSASALPISRGSSWMLTKRLRSGCGPGKPAAWRPTNLIALRHAGLDRVLQTGRVGEQRDAVRLQGDRLIHAGKPGGRTALAVDDGDVPPKLLTRFLDVDAVEMGNVVLLVAGQKDDLLAGLGLRRLGRPLPGGLRPGVFGDCGLGVGYGVGASGRDGEHPSKRDSACRARQSD